MSILLDICGVFLLVITAVVLMTPVVIAVRKIQQKREVRKFMKHLEPWDEDDN
jgi:hypothetical protein